jgi:uncharacterized protein (TIGR00255 family)
MILSMTAFASHKLTQNTISASCEIRACNSKTLDISLKIPAGYLPLEEKVKAVISEKITRGRLDVFIQISDTAAAAVAFEIDETRARAYHDALSSIIRMFSLNDLVSLEMLAGCSGVIKPCEVEKDMAAAWNVVQECVRTTLDRLIEMRTQEGDYLAADMRKRLDIMEKQLDAIEQQCDPLETIQSRLLQRIQQITRGAVEIDPARLAQEAAFLADRGDISEEIVRARSHILQFQNLMSAPEPTGRKLNFLLQEMQREINTMGSKAENPAISYQVVDIKTGIEKIREQVQNIE